MIIWIAFVIINCFQGGSKPWEHSPKVNVSGPERREFFLGQEDEPPEPLHFLDIFTRTSVTKYWEFLVVQ